MPSKCPWPPAVPVHVEKLDVKKGEVDVRGTLRERCCGLNVCNCPLSKVEVEAEQTGIVDCFKLHRVA